METVGRIYHAMHCPLETAFDLSFPRDSLDESKEILPVLIRYHLGKDLLTRRFAEKLRSSGVGSGGRRRAITPTLSAGSGDRKST